MKRTFIIIGGVLGVLIGMGFVMPAVAQWRQEGGMTNSSVALLLLGAILTLGGVVAAIWGFQQRRA